MRVAIGASRGQLAAQLLTESLVYAFGGGDIGLVAQSGASGIEGDETRPAVLLVVRASDEERAAHRLLCERIDKESKGQCLWKQVANG